MSSFSLCSNFNICDAEAKNFYNGRQTNYETYATHYTKKKTRLNILHFLFQQKTRTLSKEIVFFNILQYFKILNNLIFNHKLVWGFKKCVQAFKYFLSSVPCLNTTSNY